MLNRNMTLRYAVVVLALACASTGWAQSAPSNAVLEEQVRATERAFAKTMADRDHAAFGRFLADEAVFFGGGEPLRGKAAVMAAWKRFYEGGAAPFSWAPERVAVLEGGDLALSTGPVLNPAGTRISTFNSVWRRQADGSWKIVFDIGCPPCAAAAAAPVPAPCAVAVSSPHAWGILRRMTLPVDRRGFLKTTIGAGLGAAAAGSAHAAQSTSRAPAALFAAPALPRVRLGVIGLGNQGSSHVENFTKIEGVDVRALCDLVPAKVEAMQALVEKGGAPRPVGYSGDQEAWHRLVDSDLDLVLVVTPWELHAPMCIEAMKKGKHAAVEVPMAVTLDECWQMVETSEQTRRHCVMLENCCYDRVEMMILNMVRQQACWANCCTPSAATCTTCAHSS